MNALSHPENYVSLVGTTFFEINSGSNLANITGMATILTDSGGQVSFPAITTYTSLAGMSVQWIAQHAGSLLRFPNLVTITGPATPDTYFDIVARYRDNGTISPTVSLDTLTTITKADDGDSSANSGVRLNADTGTIYAPNLATFTDNESHPNSSLTSYNGGVIQAPNLTSSTGVNNNSTPTPTVTPTPTPTSTPTPSGTPTPTPTETPTPSPVPVAEWKGSYVAILATDEPQYNGILKVSVESSGKYVGVLKLNGHNYPFCGKFGRAGNTVQKVPGTKLMVAMNIASQVGEITGTLSNGATEVANINLSRRMKGAAMITLYQHHYTFVFHPNKNDSNTPQGDGFGTMIVSKSGVITVTGQLADGTKFSETAFLTQDAGWPFYVTLYGKKGFVSGLITITPSTDHPLSGTPIWLKPNAFTTNLTLTGDLYDGTFDVTMLAQQTFTLSGGGLTASVTGSLGEAVSTKKTAKFTDATSLLSITINLSTSVVNGTYLPTAGAKRGLPIGGVILQSTGEAEGFFLNGVESGQFELNSP